MFAIFCRRRVRALPKDCVFVAQRFWAPQNAVLVRSLSSRKSSSGVCENDSERSFTVSYLITSCGLSSKDAISASKKLWFNSPERPDAVLKFLREYGFTDAHITRMVTKWPNVILACPNKTLLPKLELFRSIGVPLPVLARNLSAYPFVLMCSLENYLIPYYKELRSLLQSDERVVYVFSRQPAVFSLGSPRRVSSNISILRERGVPESGIVSLVMYEPWSLVISEAELVGYVDRAVGMGFDVSRRGFVYAISLFVGLSESTLKRKMEVYRRCGWSEHDIGVAFLRHPLCMNISEDKIIANMEFLVNEFGCKPAYVAQYPALLNYNLEKRIKPRCLVVRILKDKGLLKNMIGVPTLLKMPEGNFLKRFVVNYEKDIPELLDIYRGKSSPIGIDFSQEIV